MGVGVYILFDMVGGVGVTIVLRVGVILEKRCISFFIFYFDDVIVFDGEFYWRFYVLFEGEVDVFLVYDDSVVDCVGFGES